MKYKCISDLELERVGQKITIKKDSIWEVQEDEYGSYIITNTSTSFTISKNVLDKLFEQVKE